MNMQIFFYFFFSLKVLSTNARSDEWLIPFVIVALLKLWCFQAVSKARFGGGVIAFY